MTHQHLHAWKRNTYIPKPTAAQQYIPNETGDGVAQFFEIADQQTEARIAEIVALDHRTREALSSRSAHKLYRVAKEYERRNLHQRANQIRKAARDL